MEPRIQYAQTKDGLSIAFYTMGEGMPFVWVPDLVFSHIGLEWQFPGFRRWCERFLEKRKLVRFDGRGTGLSERNVIDYSLDSRVLDLEAVVDRLGLEKFALFGALTTGLVAIAYAARHPEKVSHLILWCSYARASDYVGSPEMQALVGLVDADWDTFTDTFAHARAGGWSEEESARWFATFIRENVTQEAMKAFYAAIREFDVTALLSQVKCPTLVLHRRQIRWLTVDVARALASRIPDARLALLEGTSAWPMVGDTESVARAIDEFLGEGEEAAAPGLAAEDVHTILFTDVEGSTALTQRLGDAKAREVLREHERMVREALKSHGGAEVKTLGDGFMTSFSSATKALECAIAMQRAFAQRRNKAIAARPEPVEGRAEVIHIRIGMNAGEPIAEEDDLYGTAVNEAARITASAKGGEILVSDVVRQLAKGKDFLFGDRGETSLKGFEDPVRLYEVRWQG